MINFIKKITRFAIILILIGAILFVTAFAISGFNFEKMSGIKTTYSTFNETDTLTATKLSLIFDTANVYVTFDEQAEKISVSYPERTSRNGDRLNKVTCSEAKGSISIIEEESVKSNLFLWDFSTQKVEVTIPANRVLDLVIETDTGDVKFTGNASVNSLSIETDTGDINTKNSNLTVLTNANFEVDTGNIRLVKINAASISIESDTGDIYLGDCTVTNNVKIDVDTGDVTLCGVLVCETLGITTDTGEVDADEATVDANILSIETDTGDIDMKLSGKKADYEISVRHRTGDSNISNQLGSPRKLTVIAVTGDIEITFEN